MKTNKPLVISMIANAMALRMPILAEANAHLVSTGGRNKKYGIPSNAPNGGRSMFKQNRRAQIKANRKNKRR